MQPEIEKYLFDIEEACRAILELAQKSSLAEFRASVTSSFMDTRPWIATSSGGSFRLIFRGLSKKCRST